MRMLYTVSPPEICSLCSKKSPIANYHSTWYARVLLCSGKKCLRKLFHDCKGHPTLISSSLGAVLQGLKELLGITGTSISLTRPHWLRSIFFNLCLQDYIAAIYDLSVAYPDIPVFQTAADVVGAGTATARSQYYGSSNNRSLWLGGMFDYRGLSDYTPMEDQVKNRLFHGSGVFF